MLVYTCEQMRVIEENADVNGLSYVQMMENAGNGCADKIHSVICGLGGVAKSAVIICGSGRNGGDGYVIARNLCERGCSVQIILADGFPTAYESKMMYSYLEDKPVIVTVECKRNITGRTHLYFAAFFTSSISVVASSVHKKNGLFFII